MLPLSGCLSGKEASSAAQSPATTVDLATCKFRKFRNIRNIRNLLMV